MAAPPCAGVKPKLIAYSQAPDPFHPNPTGILIQVNPPGWVYQNRCKCTFTIDGQDPKSMGSDASGEDWIRLPEWPKQRVKVEADIRCTDPACESKPDLEIGEPQAGSSVDCKYVALVVLTIFTALGAALGGVVGLPGGVLGVVAGTLVGIVVGLTVGIGISFLLCWLLDRIF